MNKQELVTKLARRMSTTSVNTEKFVDAFVNEITTTLQKGKAVKLMGFGTFQTYKRKARMGRNPKTGVEVKIPAKRAVKFKVSPVFKTAIK